MMKSITACNLKRPRKATGFKFLRLSCKEFILVTKKFQMLAILSWI